MRNIFESIPESVPEEMFEDLVRAERVRIERIVSQGHASPEIGWYDQDQNEWVMVLKGAGLLRFEDGEEVLLEEGDHLEIAKHRRHKITWTDTEDVTVWLAVIYD